MPGCTNCPSDSAAISNNIDPIFRRVLWIALIANAAMFFVEITASQIGDSISLQADALDFIEKPFLEDTLVEKVLEIVNQYKC